jgi:hypothetical protein
MAGTRADSSSNSFATAPSSSVPHQTTMVSTAIPTRPVDPPGPISGRSAPSSTAVPNTVTVARMGSSVLPSVATGNRSVVPATLPFRNSRAEISLGCLNCGKNHHVSICQDRDPWEYKAPYYGSPDFGQGFYVIPDVEAEVQSLELLNYAQITVVRGEATFRDMEHEFQVWSDSMGYKWRFYVKVAAENQYITRFPNAKCIE